MAVSRKKKIIIIVAAVAVLALIVIVSIFARGNDQPEVTVVKVEVRPELKSTVTASGEVRPIKYINLTSEVPGRIEEISVNPGDQVTKGQPLVRVDPTQLESSASAQAASVQASISDTQNARQSLLAAENRVTQAQQNLAATEASLAQTRQAVVTAQTNVDREQVNLNTAQRELKRTTDLIESGVASRSEYDAARDRLEQAQVALRTAKAQLESANIAIEESKARVNQQRVAVRDAQIGVQSARTSVVFERVARQPAAGAPARLREPAQQGHDLLAADRRRRRHPGPRRHLRRRRSFDHSADDHRRHVHRQRRSQR